LGASYLPTTDPDRLFHYFGIRLPCPVNSGDVRAGCGAPIFRRSKRGSTLEREACIGVFGLTANWTHGPLAEPGPLEPRGSLGTDPPRPRDSWSLGRRCVVPADAIYEIRLGAAGALERWRIRRRDGRPFGVAAIWSEWLDDPDGLMPPTFAMLTVRARDHAATHFRAAAANGETPRMVAILEEDAYDAWLEAPLLTSQTVLNRKPGAPLVAEQARDDDGPTAGDATAPRSDGPRGKR